ncbi:MAG: divalent-cation tolerance protein CutA [Candidatus Methanomethylicia archaeon]|nr:divalent-cation tolerance protein CutA [Candidatus Methanomethylicia archaeon]
MNEYVVVFITTPNLNEAKKIVDALLEDKLIACANIVENVKSKFWWRDKIEEVNEALIIIKTKRELLKEIYVKVKNLHSYTVPEIIALPIITGYEPYLKWVNEVVK